MLPKSAQIYTEVARAASDQWGLFTSGQAHSLDATASHLSIWTRRGLIDRESHGVYRIIGAPEDLDLDGLRIAWLSTAPDQWRHERNHPPVVSHLSAAHTVYRLGTATPGKDHLTTPTPRRTRDNTVALHTDTTLTAQDWQWVDGLPVTTLERTLVDLYRSGIDGGHLGDIISDALRTGHPAHELSNALDTITAGRGRRTLEDALHTCGAPDGLAEASDLLNASRHRVV